MTKIEWADYSWNPIRARNKATGGIGHFCIKVSDGCMNCYAARRQPRFKNPIRYAAQDRGLVDIFLDEKTFAKPLHWRKPRTIFVCSMTDLFGDWVMDEWLDRIFAVMALCPQHRFMVLTKRPERMQKYLARLGKSIEPLENAARQLGYTFEFRGLSLLRWPIENCWLGVSVEDQATADARIPILLDTPAAVRFVSYEPALKPVNFAPLCVRDVKYGLDRPASIYPLRGVYQLPDCHSSEPHPKLDLVIMGGESGPGARPFQLDWARSIRDQCRAADVAYFLKQIGSNPRQGETGYPVTGKGNDMDEWPEDLRIREFPDA